MRTILSAAAYGSGLKSTTSIAAKIAVVAPIPMASAAMAVSENDGVRRRPLPPVEFDSGLTFLVHELPSPRREEFL